MRVSIPVGAAWIGVFFCGFALLLGHPQVAIASVLIGIFWLLWEIADLLDERI